VPVIFIGTSISIEEYNGMMLKHFETYCDLYGYTLDKGLSKLNEVAGHKNFKKLHISLYNAEKYMLLLKTDVDDAEIVPDDNRLVIKSNGINKSTIMNIFKNDIDECIYKVYDVNRYEMVLSLGGIFYRIFAVLTA
jgi:hypothetical protein